MSYRVNCGSVVEEYNQEVVGLISASSCHILINHRLPMDLCTSVQMCSHLWVWMGECICSLKHSEWSVLSYWNSLSLHIYILWSFFFGRLSTCSSPSKSTISYCSLLNLDSNTLISVQLKFHLNHVVSKPRLASCHFAVLTFISMFCNFWKNPHKLYLFTFKPQKLEAKKLEAEIQ